jgi:hypothetical protein
MLPELEAKRPVVVVLRELMVLLVVVVVGTVMYFHCYPPVVFCRELGLVILWSWVRLEHPDWSIAKTLIRRGLGSRQK